jgi:DNA polymerase III subunit alpha
MGFVHLQVHSGYTFMNSTLSIEKLVKGAKAKGYQAIALTDDWKLHGAIQFYTECTNENIKPILGINSFVALSNDKIYQLILLAKNNQGFETLIKLSSTSALRDFQAISIKELTFCFDDVIAILPAFQANLDDLFLKQDLEKIKELLSELMIFPNIYFGVQDHGLVKEHKVNVEVKKLSTELNVKTVAIHDVRYLHEDDYVAYDCFQYMKDGKHWSLDKDMTSSKHRHLTTVQEMEEKFLSWWPEVLANTEVIAEQCNVKLDFQNQYLPAFPTPDNLPADVFLRKQCEQQLVHRYPQEKQNEARKRMDYELSVIEQMGFSDYFLIVWDFIQYAKNNGILTGPGRGSAAGSIVAYLLHITDVDPLKYQLLFERFLNPERISMPDIDVDFSDYRRDEVIQYVEEKYGSNHVAQIVTFGTFAPRSLLRELIKTMSIDTTDAQFILREIPQHASSLADILKESEELTNYIKNSPKLKWLFKIAFKLEGLPRHHSTHAAGVIISKEPFSKMVPIMKGTQNITLTQYPMKDLEQIGLLKMDFLGLRNLTLLEQIVKKIQKAKPDFQLENIPLDDEKTFKLLQEGKTTGVFQLESSGMRKVLKDLKPSSFHDVVAVNALFRPGPMDFIPTYIRRKHRQEKVTYLHPDLKPILESTFGVLVYQEQIMQIAHQFAGLSLSEADLLRRAISKKDKKILDAEKERFIQGCMKNGYSKEIGAELYEWIVRFANYGFNKSHAVAYSMISYQLAYLKAHYPSYFFASLLTSVAFDQEKVRQYVKEAKELGINILPPSINHSYATFTVENKQSIRIALSVVKGIGKQVIDAILTARKNQPFRSLFDFCHRVPLHVINRSVIENLILAGAFDETHSNRASLLASIDQALEQGELFGGMDGQESLFGEDFLGEYTYTEIEPFPPLKQLALEKEVLGLYVSSHPLAAYRNRLRENGLLTISQLKESYVGKKINVAAAIQDIRVIRTKRGDQMAFCILADESDEVEGVIFPDTFREIKPWLKDELIIFLDGKLEVRNNEPQIILNHATPFTEDVLQTLKSTTTIYIKLLDKDEREQLHFLQKLATLYPGPTPIIVYSSKRKETYRLSSNFYLKASNSCLNQLKDYFGKGNVVWRKE